MSSCTRKPAQLSTLLCFPQLAARPGLPGIPWAAPATAPTVPEHGAERGWNGNRQLMGTQRLVKTFSSGDAVVWRFLSGAQPAPCRSLPLILHYVYVYFSVRSPTLSFFISFLLPSACHVLMSCLFQLRYCFSSIYLQWNTVGIPVGCVSYPPFIPRTA